MAKREQENKVKEISVEIEGVPDEWPALKPFSVVLHAKNISSETVTGKIGVAELNDSIFVFGNNNLSFTDFKPNQVIDFKIEFIAMKQGTYKFPAFDFDIDNGNSFRLNNSLGILVVGHYDDE